MSSLSTGHDLSDAPPTSPGAQTLRAAVDSASANVDAVTSAPTYDELNPLWVIAGAMALFFAVAAAFLASA